MKPLMSEEGKRITVNNFLASYFDKKARVTNFKEMVTALKKKTVVPLYDLKPTGKTVYTNFMGELKERFYYVEDDAKEYFEWLVRVVFGVEKRSKAVIGKAFNQLFFLIYAMRDDIETDEHIQFLAPYNWADRLESFEKELAKIRSIIDKRDKDISETIATMLLWVEKIGAVLDKMDKEYSNLVGKVEPKND